MLSPSPPAGGGLGAHTKKHGRAGRGAGSQDDKNQEKGKAQNAEAGEKLVLERSTSTVRKLQIVSIAVLADERLDEED